MTQVRSKNLFANTFSEKETVVVLSVYEHLLHIKAEQNQQRSRDNKPLVTTGEVTTSKEALKGQGWEARNRSTIPAKVKGGKTY